jgi:tRNA nucleotidyltransferase (CCA-adding enzyme)
VELIVSHTNADFDALGSMVAASLLYPAAVMALPGGADRNVREFLALHADAIRLLPPNEVPLERVRRLIVVETQHAKRLGRFAALLGRPDVEVILYDHHAPHHPDIPATEQTVEAYGACTTLMVTLLRRRDIAVDPLRATVLALGIYEDTGSLTFGATTPEDVETVGWLLRQGANLDIVAQFVNRTLTESQRRILNLLLASSEHHRIHGLQILVATADASGSADELSLLAHKLRDLESSDAVFALFRLDHAVLLVARSSVDAINAGAVAHAFGGGGHDRAASAMLHHQSLDDARRALLAVLDGAVQPRVTAATLMSYPVRTITPDTTMDEAARLMLRYGHGGLTVMDGDRVAGIITRRDVDRAIHHGFPHAPVRGYLGREVVTLTPATPLPEIERIMIEHHVGRLPVLDGGRLVGIVTRSDILRALHGERYARQHTLFGAAGPSRNLWPLLEERVPPAEGALLTAIAEISTDMGLLVYLVGGAVRDLLLGNPMLDLDLLVEGEGISLAEEVGRRLGGHVVTHPKFHTGTVTLPDGRSADFATARTEYYPYPAALPTAEHSTVREDLYRRDFTINAMAVALNGAERGALLDPFGGGRDLADGALRVLHALSFVEDPTRILRAVRFEARFGFLMEPRTEELARHAIAEELLDRLSGARVREELLAIFARPHPEVALQRLDSLGVLAALEPAWHAAGPAPEYARLEEALAWAAGEPAVAAHLIDPAHQRLLLVFTTLAAEVVTRLTTRLRIRRREALLAAAAPALPGLAVELAQPLPLSAVDARLYPLAIPLCLLLLAHSDDRRVWDTVQTYLTHTRHLPPLLSGYDLRRLGIPRGPAYTRIMRAIRTAQLDGQLATHDDALALARTLADTE